MKTSWRRLSSSSSRRLQGVLIKTNMFALALRLQKTSWRCLQDVLVKINIFVLAIRLQDVFKTFSRHLQDVFKTHHQVKLFLLTRLWKVFNTFLRLFFQRRLSTEGHAQVTLLLINLWSVHKICKRDKNFSSFSFSIYYTFSGCI